MPELRLIMGPHGAGKTTYAAEVYPDHLQWDHEDIARLLLPWGRHLSAAALLRAERPLAPSIGWLEFWLAERLLTMGHDVCLTIRGETRSERLNWLLIAGRAGATCHLERLIVARDECVRRAQADVTRSRTSRGAWPSMVDRWFRSYAQWPVDSEIERFASYREIER